jgi:hypothetical protein
MSPAEADILEAGLSDPDIVTGYFFRHSGEEVGWRFDHNFTPEGKWQKEAIMASQAMGVIITGVGAGKTLGVGMGATYFGLEVPWFKFLNVAQKAWQSNLMYQALIEQAQGTLMEALFYETPRRPYPKIVIKYNLKGVVRQSSLEFMSADKDALGLMSWRGDWINVEEAGLFENLDEIITNTSTRLTGSSPLGREYYARLTLISNPWDVPYLWYLFDLAKTDPQENFSITVPTQANRNVTDKQIARLVKRIPKDQQRRFLMGARPEGKGSFFKAEHVDACEDEYAGELIAKAAAAQRLGFSWESISGVGVYEFSVPPRNGRVYMVFGDPGSGAAPARNAPCIGAWDVTEFPRKPMVLSAFWWGNGFGAISPFVERLLEWMGRNPGLSYRAMFTGIDSTGPQAQMAEILNAQYFEITPFENLTAEANVSGIVGLDFSGSKKSAYLLALRLTIEAHKIRWPKAVGGIRSQLVNYEPERDRGPLPKLPQDIVAMMAMSTFVARSYYATELEALLQEQAGQPEPDDTATLGMRRRDEGARNVRSYTR